MSKKRVAIIGAGPAGLGAAFELTNNIGWNDRFEVDVYTMGWRLGGKCASSRNRALNWRNEEHGLHILGGFYHNTFALLRRLYAEWPLASEHPIPFESAFFGHDTFTLMQRDANGWHPLRVYIEPNPLALGANPERACVGTVLHRMTNWLARELEGLALEHLRRAAEAEAAPASDETAVAHHRAGHAEFSRLASAFTRHASAPHKMMAEGFDEAHHQQLADSAKELQACTHRARHGGPKAAIRGADWVTLVEILATVVRGFVADRLTLRGYDCVNHLETSAWLRQHGASDRALNSALYQSMYHYAFAFTDGDPAKPDVAAGVLIRASMRMLFTYHQSLFVHMNGGMGEIIAAPFYEVLRKRGVRFHFFHRMEEIIPGADQMLSAIRMRVQARTKYGGAYEPLVNYAPPFGQSVRRVWPEAPLLEQLADGEGLSGLDLESWNDSENIGELRVLEAGKDFDIAVVATPIGTLRHTAKGLAAVDPGWNAMLRSAGTCPTMAAQIWRNEPAEKFAGVADDRLFTGYELPHSSWSDMSFLLPLEDNRTSGTTPRSLSYLCGPAMCVSKGQGRNLVAAEHAVAVRATEEWLRKFTSGVLPGICDGGGLYRADGELSRMVRMNSDPASLYVTTPAGSVQHRLKPDGSGFNNLFLAGDWTKNTLDVGCVEAAVGSAMLCARAIDGVQRDVYGESDFR